MTLDELRAELERLDGTEILAVGGTVADLEDANDVVQEALEAGLCGFTGTYRINGPITLSGVEHHVNDPMPESPDTSGILGKLSATFLSAEE